MYVIGTAGHVDHGKSTLVRALTGIDPDRLKEEQARQMTIDLGFAFYALPDGELVGIVDVPGHRDFIENMLAGVGGIHLALFVIAADEGVMPQTREHLAILDLLQIPGGVIALTKMDMVPDEQWLDMVQLDILEHVTGTVLDGAPILPVSARTGAGLDTLRATLDSQLRHSPPATDVGRPRLWIDRVFSVSGFGTVVTGTLLDGQLTTGQEVEIQPRGLRGRIRGLQSHNMPLEQVNPGSRVAVNLNGVERNDVRRGDLLTLPETISPSHRLSVRFRHLPEATQPLRHNAEVKFFCGSAETMARVRVLDANVLPPGSEGWLQVELRENLPLLKGDRFILRNPSPGETIGGGEVVEANITRRYHRNRPEVIAALEAATHTAPAELIALTQQSHQQELLDRLMRIVAAFHKADPLRTGIKPESLAHQLGLSRAELNELLSGVVASGAIRITATGTIAQPGFSPQPSKSQRAAIDRALAAFEAAPYAPPSYKETAEILGETLLTALLEWETLVRLSGDVLLTPKALHDFADSTRQALAEEGKITIKTLRDRLQTSRKYAQAVLEYFDSLGLTRRDGDDHVAGSEDWTKVG
ncbi:MAG TPA: selenocysteine-specific translation elongation factor [Aggregatilineales bacterium]|nr:selenocysteine-specific translation elongation factor [Aggregatilineales bacterium]